MFSASVKATVSTKFPFESPDLSLRMYLDFLVIVRSSVVNTPLSPV